jgi:hypothetical protein
MTSGIYKLNFIGATGVYIGQSIDIERRYTAHKRAMGLGVSAKKLQNAYSLYGYPTLEILVEVNNTDELDDLEVEAIDIYDSVNTGFNSISTPNKCTISGELASNAKYTNEVYIKIFNLLVEYIYSDGDIAEQLDVSQTVVRSIRKLENHKWLKELFPEKYSLLEKRKTSFVNGLHNNAEARGIIYPELLAPNGLIYKVSGLREFAREHGFHSSNLQQLLAGKLTTLKGWRLVDKPLPTYPSILSPTGKVYNIEYNKASSFAKEHGLSPGNLSMLLSKQKSSYKGWTLVKND